MCSGGSYYYLRMCAWWAQLPACATSVAGPAAALLREVGAARDIATRRLRADYAQLAGHTQSGGAA